jgi:uncharacterized membrane protein
MMNPDARPVFIRLILLLTVVSIAVFLFRERLAVQGADWRVLVAGNGLLFGVHTLAFGISYRALRSSNPQAFVRSMYGSFLLKFFGLALAAFVYIMLERRQVSKMALAGLAALYIVYTAVEVRGLLGLLKARKHA